MRVKTVFSRKMAIWSPKTAIFFEGARRARAPTALVGACGAHSQQNAIYQKTHAILAPFRSRTPCSAKYVK
jgi:hypothetical protein